MSASATGLGQFQPTHHERRIERVLVALRKQRAQQALGGAVPPALNQAITDFSRQLRQLRTTASVIEAPLDPDHPSV